MRDIVVDILRGENLLPSNKEPKINILLSGTIGFEVFCDEKLLYFVKLSVKKEKAGLFDLPYFDLQAEYLSQVKSYSAFPEFVAKPVGYYQVDIFDLFICKGVSHFPVNPNDIKGMGDLFDKLKCYFESARSGLIPDEKNERNISLLENVVKNDEVSERRDCIKKWLCGDKLKVLENLDEVSQHGDFSINNIGLTQQKKLVIFDWEDMGKVYLPGFDLFTLAISILGFDKIEVIKLLQGKSSYYGLSAFVREACDLCFIDPEIFMQLSPVYLSVFIFLKKHYSILVREKAAGLMDEASRIF